MKSYGGQKYYKGRHAGPSLKGKQPNKNATRHRLDDRGPSRKRPRQSAVDEISMFERKIKKSETSIAKIQAHTERGSCPRDLRYVAKANITPDEEFKTDIKAVKREAERKFIGALTKFHYRCIERNKGKLQRAKSDISRSKKDTDRAGKTPRAQPNSSSIVPESVSNIKVVQVHGTVYSFIKSISPSIPRTIKSVASSVWQCCLPSTGVHTHHIPKCHCSTGPCTPAGFICLCKLCR